MMLRASLTRAATGALSRPSYRTSLYIVNSSRFSLHVNSTRYNSTSTSTKQDKDVISEEIKTELTKPSEPTEGNETNTEVPVSYVDPARAEWAVHQSERSLIPPQSRPLKPSERPIEKWEESTFYGLQVQKDLKTELSEFLDEPKLLTPEWKANNIKMSGMDLSSIELNRKGKKIFFLFCLTFPIVAMLYFSRDEWLPHFNRFAYDCETYVKSYFWEMQERNTAPLSIAEIQLSLDELQPEGGIITVKELATTFSEILPKLSQPVPPGYVMYAFEQAGFKSTTKVDYQYMYPVIRTLFTADDYFMLIDKRSGRRHCPLTDVMRLMHSIGQLNEDEVIQMCGKEYDGNSMVEWKDFLSVCMNRCRA